MKQSYSFQRWSTKGQGADGKESQARQKGSADKWMTEHGAQLGYPWPRQWDDLPYRVGGGIGIRSKKILQAAAELNKLRGFNHYEAEAEARARTRP